MDRSTMFDQLQLNKYSADYQALVLQACDITEKLIETLPDKMEANLSAHVVAVFIASIVDGTTGTMGSTLKQRRESVDTIANFAKQMLALPAPANTARNA